MPNSGQIHSTAPKAISGYFANSIPAIISSAIMALAVSWYNLNQSRNDTESRLIQLEKQAITNANNIQMNSKNLNDMMITAAENKIILNNLLETIRELKANQKPGSKTP